MYVLGIAVLLPLKSFLLHLKSLPSWTQCLSWVCPLSKKKSSNDCAEPYYLVVPTSQLFGDPDSEQYFLLVGCHVVDRVIFLCNIQWMYSVLYCKLQTVCVLIFSECFTKCFFLCEKLIFCVKLDSSLSDT